MQLFKILFLNCNFLPTHNLARDQTKLHPSTLIIPLVVIGDQLTSIETALFYNSNCFKPNGSTSPFRKTQLDNTKLCSATIATGFCSCRNASLRSCLGIAIPMLLGTFPNKEFPHRVMQAKASCLKTADHQECHREV